MVDTLTVLKSLRLRPYKREVVERLPSGSIELDALLGGGWVKGGVNEIAGDAVTGKSLMTFLAINAALKRGRTAVLFDSENVFEMKFARQFFNPLSPNFALVQNMGGEDVCNLIGKLAYNQSRPLIVLDSWNALAFGMDRALDLAAADGLQNEVYRMRGWLFASFLRGLNLATGTFLFTSHKPVQIGHVVPLTAYSKLCDARVEMLNAPRPMLRAKVVGGIVTRRSEAERVW